MRASGYGRVLRSSSSFGRHTSATKEMMWPQTSTSFTSSSAVSSGALRAVCRRVHDEALRCHPSRDHGVMTAFHRPFTAFRLCFRWLSSAFHCLSFALPLPLIDLPLPFACASTASHRPFTAFRLRFHCLFINLSLPFDHACTHPTHTQHAHLQCSGYVMIRSRDRARQRCQRCHIYASNQQPDGAVKYHGVMTACLVLSLAFIDLSLPLETMV